MGPLRTKWIATHTKRTRLSSRQKACVRLERSVRSESGCQVKLDFGMRSDPFTLLNLEGLALLSPLVRIWRSRCFAPEYQYNGPTLTLILALTLALTLTNSNSYYYVVERDTFVFCVLIIVGVWDNQVYVAND